MQDTWVQSLDWEDPLEEEMATLSSILAWKIPWTGGPGKLQSMGSPQNWIHTATLGAHMPMKHRRKKLKIPAHQDIVFL